MSPNPKLRFLCFGVGAIGTYIGGSLALAGNDVLFIERPGVAEDIRQKGLKLGLLDGEKVILKPEVVETIDQALTRGPFDLAILAVKAYDTRDLMQELVNYSVALPPFLCLQNGVENEAEIAAVLGLERVIAGSVTTAIGRRAAGDIFVERLRGIGIASTHFLSPSLAALLNQAGLHAHLYNNAASMKWSKLITNLIANASSAILDMTPAAIFADPRLFKMEIRMLREALNVMDAQNIPVTDLPGTPVKLLTWIVKSIPPYLSIPILRRALGSGRGGKMPSFHIDLYGGRKKSEVDFLNGAVVRFGEKCGIKTPVNKILTQTLLRITSGEITREQYRNHPDRLLELVGKF
jgi:2-dehydropantoate 2-reductase